MINFSQEHICCIIIWIFVWNFPMQVARNENFLIYVNVVSLKLKMLTLANAASDHRTWDASKSECLESRSGLQLFPGEIFDPWIFSGIWNGTKCFFADFSTLYFAVKVMKPQRGVPEANRSILVCVEKGNSILFHDEALFDIWGDKSNRVCPLSRIHWNIYANHHISSSQ